MFNRYRVFGAFFVIVMVPVCYYSWAPAWRVSEAAEAKAVSVDLTKSTAIIVEVSGAKVEDLGWLPIVKELWVKNGTGLKAVVVALNGESFMDDHGNWCTAFVEDLVHEPYPGSYVQIGTGIGGIEPGYGYAHVYRMSPQETNAPGAVSYFVGSGPVPGPDACVAFLGSKGKAKQK
jgi:hypothetical protein